MQFTYHFAPVIEIVGCDALLSRSLLNGAWPTVVAVVAYRYFHKQQQAAQK